MKRLTKSEKKRRMQSRIKTIQEQIDRDKMLWLKYITEMLNPTRVDIDFRMALNGVQKFIKENQARIEEIRAKINAL